MPSANPKVASTPRAAPPPLWRVWSATNDSVDQRAWLDLGRRNQLGLSERNAVLNGMIRLESVVFDRTVLWQNSWLDGVRYDYIGIRELQGLLDNDRLEDFLVLASGTGSVSEDYRRLLAPNPAVETGQGFHFSSLLDAARQAELARAVARTARADLYNLRFRDDLLRRIGGDEFQAQFEERFQSLRRAIRLGHLPVEPLRLNDAAAAALRTEREALEALCNHVRATVAERTPAAVFAERLLRSREIRPEHASGARSQVYRALAEFTRLAGGNPEQTMYLEQLRSRYDRWHRVLRISAANCAAWPQYVYAAARPSDPDLPRRPDARTEQIRRVARWMSGVEPATLSQTRAAMQEMRPSYLRGAVGVEEYVAPVVGTLVRAALPGTANHIRDLLNDAAKRVLLVAVFREFSGAVGAALGDSLGIHGDGDDVIAEERARELPPALLDKAADQMERKRRFAAEGLRAVITQVVATAVEGARPGAPWQ